MSISERFLQPATLTRFSSGSSLTLSGSLVTGNVLSLIVNGTPVSTIFAGSSITTMIALAAAIDALAGVTAVVNSGDPLRIDMTPNGLSITDLSLIGGASQATPSLHGGFFSGSYIPGLAITSSIKVSIQPLGGLELMNLPEAQRGREQTRMYCDTALQIADVPNGIKADLVTLGDGRQYEVHQVAPWAGLGRAFWRVVAARVSSQTT